VRTDLARYVGETIYSLLLKIADLSLAHVVRESVSNGFPLEESFFDIAKVILKRLADNGFTRQQVLLFRNALLSFSVTKWADSGGGHFHFWPPLSHSERELAYVAHHYAIPKRGERDREKVRVGQANPRERSPT